MFHDTKTCGTMRPNTLANMRAALGDDVITIMCSDFGRDCAAIVVLKPEHE